MGRLQFFYITSFHTVVNNLLSHTSLNQLRWEQQLDTGHTILFKDLL